MSRGVWGLLLVIAVASTVFAQGAPKAPPAVKAPAVAPPAAIVNGDAITGEEFLSISDMYVRQAHDQAEKTHQKFGPADEKSVRTNILGELINDHLWIQEARRRGIAIPDSAVDNRLRANDFFRANGKVDEQKWQAYKTSPNSNYAELSRRMKNGLYIEKLFAALDKQFSPDEKVLRDEYERQNRVLRVSTLWIRPDPSMLDDELSRADVESFYKNHQPDFETKEQLECTVATFNVGTAHDSSWEASRVHADSLLQLLKGGATLDSLTAPRAVRLSTGWYPKGSIVPRTRGSKAFSDSLFDLKPGEVYGSVVLCPQGYGIVRVDGHKPSEIRSLKESWGQAYRMASTERTKVQDEQEQRNRFTNYPARYRTRKSHVMVLYFDPRAQKAPPGPTRELLQRLYQIHSAAFVYTDTAGVRQVRPFAEVESTVVRMYPAWMADSINTESYNIAWALANAGRDVFTHPPAGAQLRDFPSVTSTFDDSLVTPTIVDGMMALAPGLSQRSEAAVLGSLVYRVVSTDTTYLPPFDEVRGRIQQELLDERKTAHEKKAHDYYDAHKDEFMSDTMYVIKFAGVRRVQPKELGLDEGRARAWYRKTISKYSTSERSRLQAIVLLLFPNSTPAEKAAARSRADSIRVQAARGQDFGALATQFSEDPGSAKRGGDIGYQTRESLRDTTIANPAFRLKTGEVSRPIMTPRGVVLFRCAEHLPATVQPYDAVKDQVYDDMSTVLGDSAAQHIAENALRVARNATDLEQQSIRYHGSGMSQSQPFQLKDPVFNLGDLPEVKAELPHMKKGEVGVHPAKGPGNYLMWMLYDILPPAPLSWDKAKEQALKRVDNLDIDARVQQRADSLQARVLRGDSLSEAGYDLGVLTPSGTFQRGGFIPGLGSASLVDTFVTRARPGEISGPIQMPVSTGGGIAFVQYLGADPYDASQFEKQKKFLTDQKVQEKKQDLLNQMRKVARVRIFRPDLKGAWTPPVAARVGR